MFGELAPRLKGGFNRLMQSVALGYAVYKGPPDVDLLIAAGDSPARTRALILSGGDAQYNAALGNVVSGGNVTLRGGVGAPLCGSVFIYGGGAATGVQLGGSYTGGSVTMTAGSGLTATGTISLTGGAGDASATCAGGAVSVTGGIGGGNAGTGGDVNVTGGGSPAAVAGGNVRIRPGGGTSRSANILLDGGVGNALATSAAGGFVQFPSCAGTPTGTPISIATGMVPVVFDTTNSRFYAYLNSAWAPINAGGAINSRSADYTTTLADGGPNRAILHPSSDANNRTFTIAANSSVAYEVGRTLTFINDSANAVTIAITTDTLVLEGAGTTGSRTLAQYGRAIATKISATRWYITGTNLT